MFTLNLKGKLWTIDKPVVMGILNVTPDSFFTDSRINDPQFLLDTAGKMIEDGAMIIDIGGQSTNPKSTFLSAETEAERVIPAIELLLKHFRELVISIDTFYGSIAKQAVAAGASMVNDISGGTLDGTMTATVAELNVPYVCMHMRGTPQTMQQHLNYENVTKEVLDFFIAKTEQLKQEGVNDIIIDPGFGFAKSIPQNFQLIKELAAFKMLGKPVLIGVSRKSTIYKTLATTPKHALNGTTVLNTIALMNGADILRVHDVKEAFEAVKLTEAIINC